jgi:hypothetical protein
MALEDNFPKKLKGLIDKVRSEEALKPNSRLYASEGLSQAEQAFRSEARKKLSLGLFEDVKKEMERMTAEGAKKERLLDLIKEYILRLFETSVVIYISNENSMGEIQTYEDKLVELGIDRTELDAIVARLNQQKK